MTNPNEKKIEDTDTSYESPEDTKAWDEVLTSVDGQELMDFLIAEANDELAQGKFTEDKE